MPTSRSRAVPVLPLPLNLVLEVGWGWVAVLALVVGWAWAVASVMAEGWVVVLVAPVKNTRGRALSLRPVLESEIRLASPLNLTQKP